MHQFHHIHTSDLSATMAASSVTLAVAPRAGRSSHGPDQTASCGLLPQSAIDLLTEMFDKRRYAMVMTLAASLLSEAPNSVYLLNLLGETAAILKRNEEAVVHYLALIDCDPTDGERLRKAAFLPNVHNNLSIVLKELGLLSEAEVHIREAIRLRPRFALAHNTYGTLLNERADLQGAQRELLKAIELDPNDHIPYWNLQSTVSDIEQATEILEACLHKSPGFQQGVIALAGLRAFSGDASHFDMLQNAGFSDDPMMRSIGWVLSLPRQPEVHFNRWSVFDRATYWSDPRRPFYEFGVWMGDSFRYLMRKHERGYGFDTFSGLPEAWRTVPQGTYTSFGRVPEIEGAEFIVGEFSATLPSFFSEPRGPAGIMNFDADLYTSTLCALTNARSVIDAGTVLIFDEFIVNSDWEQDEYRALNEFCEKYGVTYEVLAVSLFTKQMVCKIHV